MENLNSVIYFVASLCGAIFLPEPQWLDDPAAEVLCPNSIHFGIVV